MILLLCLELQNELLAGGECLHFLLQDFKGS